MVTVAIMANYGLIRIKKIYLTVYNQSVTSTKRIYGGGRFRFLEAGNPNYL
jgi:hypothetical protein